MILKKELTLKEIQKCELKILEHVDKFCRENDIKYSLTGGTLLGAIRHKGFIPWDDDIDIVMLREDYEKFLNLYKDSEFVLYNSSKQTDYYYSYSKIIYKKTEMKENNLLPINGYGVYLDVFPLDNINNSQLIANAKISLLKIVRKLHALSNYKSIPSDKSSIEKIFGNIIFPICKMIGFKKFIKVENWIINLFISKESNYVANMFSYYGIKEKMPKYYFKEIIECDFEDKRVFILKEYDKFLKSLFNDYFKLPPKDKRITHHKYQAYYIEL